MDHQVLLFLRSLQREKISKCMPMLITDEMLNEFCLTTNEAGFVSALKDKYHGMADRLTVYNPFVPGRRVEFWKQLIH